ncbi:MAG: hypothetical protein MI922_21315, partial [Bacteroidales bacterium]|nr:hypothetical protein [Bacteroidales bacterium]
EKKEKYADTLRKMNEHENNLLNMRITWFSALQGLLFASLGFIWEENVPIAIILVISGLGIIVAISLFSSVNLTRKAYDQLKEWWNNNLGDYNGPPINGYEVDKDQMTFIRLFRPWRILPWAFIAGWLVIGICGVIKEICS